MALSYSNKYLNNVETAPIKTVDDQVVTGSLSADAIAEWCSRYTSTADSRAWIEPYWEVYLALYRNMPWFYVGANNQLFHDFNFQNSASWADLTSPRVHRASAAVGRNDMVPEAYPIDPSSDQAVIDAKVTTRALQHLDDHVGHSSLDSLVRQAAAIFGTVFTVDFWDKQAMATVPMPTVILAYDESTGQYSFQQMQTQHTHGRFGEVGRDMVMPTELFFPPGVRDLDRDAGWIIRKIKKPLRCALYEYPDYKQEIMDAAGNKGEQSRPVFDIERTFTDYFNHTSEPPVVILECWQKHTETGAWGRFEIIGKTHVNKGEKMHKFQPFRTYRWIYDPCRFYGIGLIQKLENLQRYFNFVWTLAQQATVRSVKNIILFPGKYKGSPITTGFGDIVETPSMQYAAAPIVFNPAAIKPEMFKLIEVIPRLMDEASGMGDVFQGRAQANVRSAGMVEKLKEQDMLPLADIARRMNREDEISYNRRLALMRDGYSETRWIGAVGQKYGTFDTKISGDMIGNVGGVRLIESGRGAKSTAQRQDFMLAIANTGLLQEGRQPELERLMRLMGVSAAVDDMLYEDELLAARQVMKENEAFKNGSIELHTNNINGNEEKVLIYRDTMEQVFNVHQDHARHIQLHRRTTNSPDFELWTPMAKAMYYLHLDQEHSAYVGNLQAQGKSEQFDDAAKMAKIKQMEKMNPTGQNGGAIITEDDLNRTFKSAGVA